MRSVYFVSALILTGSFAYISSAQCTYPVNLQFQWERSFPLSSQCLSIQHDSTKPYIYVAGKERGLIIYDVSNVNNPVQVDSVPISMMNNMEVVNVEQSGAYVYLSLGNTYQNTSKPGIAIVDVSDPAHAVFKDYWYYDAAAGGGGIVKVYGDYAYFGAMRRGLFILNVSDKSNITVTSHLELAKNWPNPATPDSLKYNARGLELRGNYLYLCYDAGGLRVIDIADKLNPAEIAHYSNPAVFGKARAYNSIVLDDTIAYIGADYCGMEILDVANLANITQLGWWNPWGCETPANTWTNSQGYVNELRYNKACHLMFMSGGTTDLSVVNVADPANPQLCATYGQSADTLATWGIGLYQNQVYLSFIYNPFCFPFCSYWPGMKMLNWNNACDLEVKNVKAAHVLNIYPNPAADKIFLSGLEDTQPVKIYDIVGRELLSALPDAAGNISLSIGAWTPGIYIARYKELSSRIIKE